MSDGTLTDLMERVVQRGRAGLDGPSGHMGMSEIDSAAVRIAESLSDRGIAPHEPVVVSIANRPADIATLLGVWRSGAVAVPLSASAPSAVYTTLKTRAGARMIVGPDGIDGEIGTQPPRSLQPGAALVIFTSGSTGTPKGVVIEHQRLASKVAVLARLLAVGQDDVVLVPLQLTFIFGLWVTLLGLRVGARVVLIPSFTPAAMAQAASYGATVAGMVPTMLRSLPADSTALASTLRLVLTGGEPFGSPLAQRVAMMFPRATVFDLYGSTETGSCDFVAKHGLAISERGALGRPTEGVEFRLVDGSGHPVGPGEQGELQIRTPYRMLEYCDAPELTAAAFTGDYFRTGDLARVRSDGLVELVGRLKEIISRGGVKIAPLELDYLFVSHPDIESALTGSVPHERLGEAVHVLVVLRKGSTTDARALRDWAATRIERSKLPDAIHVVDGLPVGSTGKADRSAVAIRVGLRSAVI